MKRGAHRKCRRFQHPNRLPSTFAMENWWSLFFDCSKSKAKLDSFAKSLQISFWLVIVPNCAGGIDFMCLCVASFIVKWMEYLAMKFNSIRFQLFAFEGIFCKIFSACKFYVMDFCVLSYFWLSKIWPKFHYFEWNFRIEMTCYGILFAECFK